MQILSQDFLCLGLDFQVRTHTSCGNPWSGIYEERVKSQKASHEWGKKCDSAEESMTQFWFPMRDSKRNQVRQLVEVDADVDSCRKTEMKDPNSEEGIQRNTR